MEWQNFGGDNWAFGEKVRGVVRKSLAEVYYEDKADNCQGAWLWFLIVKDERGHAHTLRQAIVDAEKCLMYYGYLKQ
jgi:hypothetical protein